MTGVLYRLPEPEEAVFIRRPNRFLLTALRDSGEKVKVHVPDPGRLKELLYSGNRLLILPVPPGRKRKTRWTLAGAAGSGGWVLVNTSMHRKIAENLFRSSFSPFGHVSQLRAEVRAPSGKSRFDFLLDHRWVEVKGCTLRRGRRALFPDAPTSRGRKHLLELAEMAEEGLRAAVLFLVFVRDVECFAANTETDPLFAAALGQAINAGVEVRAVQLAFDGREIRFTGELPLSSDP